MAQEYALTTSTKKLRKNGWKYRGHFTQRDKLDIIADYLRMIDKYYRKDTPIILNMSESRLGRTYGLHRLMDRLSSNRDTNKQHIFDCIECGFVEITTVNISKVVTVSSALKVTDKGHKFLELHSELIKCIAKVI